MAKVSEKFLQVLAQAFPGDQELLTWAQTGNFGPLAMILFAAGPAKHIDDIQKSATISEADKKRIVLKIQLCQQLYAELYKSYYKP